MCEGSDQALLALCHVWCTRCALRTGVGVGLEGTGAALAAEVDVRRGVEAGGRLELARQGVHFLKDALGQVLEADDGAQAAVQKVRQRGAGGVRREALGGALVLELRERKAASTCVRSEGRCHTKRSGVRAEADDSRARWSPMGEPNERGRMSFRASFVTTSSPLFFSFFFCLSVHRSLRLKDRKFSPSAGASD